jgi:hypothetical protein
MIVNATIAASGKYIRCSAAISVGIGRTLDVGASVRKNHAPANPAGRRFATANAVSASSSETTIACGRTSIGERVRGQP